MMAFRFVFMTSALALTVAGAATAAAQDSPFKVILSGDAQFDGAYAAQKQDSQTRSVEFRNRFRLAVMAEARTGNGLVYGGYVRMETANPGGTQGAVDYDRAYVNVGGAFGTLYLGSHTSFNDDVGVSRPTGYLIEDDATFLYFGASNAPAWTGGALNMAGLFERVINVPGNATKVRYDTPIVGGARLSFSYTPRQGDPGWSINRRSDGTSGVALDVFEAGIKYDNKDMIDRFGGVGVVAGAGYQTGDYDLAGFKNISAYQAGLNLSYAGFTAGGGYVYTGNSQSADADPDHDKNHRYNLGLQYQAGPMTVGASYSYGVKDANPSGPGRLKLRAWEAGVLYNVAQGMRVGAEYGRIAVSNEASAVRDLGNVFLVSTQVTF
jgi:outer membrane protein OmpU